MDIGQRRKRLTKRLAKAGIRPKCTFEHKPRFAECTYSVIDVETTGVLPRDRLIEIAIVRFTGDGRCFDEWSTLINPGRDLGAYRIHRLNRFRYVRHAPRFADVAGDIVGRLAGTVVAAHNISFDARFLRSEIQRLGCELPQLSSLCTLRLGCALGAPSRRLEECCLAFGIPIPRAHSALSDAWGTARLLAAYLALAQVNGLVTIDEVGALPAVPPASAWPALPSAGTPLTRQEAEERFSQDPCQQEDDSGSYIRRLIARLPAETTEDEVEYFQLLDRALEDFRITLAEANALQSMAAEVGLTPRQVASIHERYVEQLVLAAWEDGVVTAEEQQQLGLVAELLGFTPDQLTSMVEEHEPR